MTKKTDTTTETTQAQVPAQQTITIKPESDKIWEEIRSLPIQMFGLPNQLVAMHCQPVPVEPSSLYLMIRSQAVLPSLEAAIGNDYTVELVAGYVVVKRALKMPVLQPFPMKR